MKVQLIAHTYWCGNTSYDIFDETGWNPDILAHQDENPDTLGEFAGRACYQSWNKPNPKTATNEGYLRNILGMGHESVLEHASATFYIQGVSRYLTHELVRHRHGQWSQLSSRYVDVTEPVRHPHMSDAEWYLFQEHFRHCVALYQDAVQNGVARGLKRKEARESARFFLPGGTETKIVMTGNLRAYRDILKKRHHVAADAEIQELAGKLLAELRTIAPNSFQDIPEEPYS